VNARSQQVLEVYTTYRFTDQLNWYEGRIKEFQAAKQQVITISGVLLFLASVSGFLASSDVAGLRALWAVLAAAFSAFSAAIAAYSTLMGFEHVAKLYEDAVATLDGLRANLPDPGHLASGPEAHPVIQAFVTNAEAVFRKEAGQWGQLAVSPPSAKPAESGADGSGGSPAQ
jgi:SMODS and SLOG-associating 2TM effector domain 1